MKTLAVTRPTGEGVDTASFIRKLGWNPLIFHTVQLKPRSRTSILREINRPFSDSSPEWIVFMSPRGANVFFNALKTQPGLRRRILENCRVLAVGPKTRSALKQLKAKKVVMPQNHSSDGVADYLSQASLRGKRVVLARSSQGSETLGRRLRAEEAVVTTVPLYDSTIPDDGRSVSRFLAWLSSSRVDATLFTSSISAINLFEMGRTDFPPRQLRKLLGSCPVGAIGPTTASRLRRLGVEPAFMPKRYTIAAAITGLVQVSSKQ